ncbi:WAT1-related protein At1g68170-like [Carya illinoinensis]|uniref:WAT1-related protein At1g68170-like n=1 Tax=Carya illinoinensis TaxID=32201 RepID=UPI001C7247BB|nr:WAT1-related protein At1g68170-like [Carya illinoinensis]
MRVILQKVCNTLNRLKPAMLVVAFQFALAGVNFLYKLAANDGMNLRVLVAYRHIFATAFVAPLALVLERESRPKLTRMVLFQSFLCGLFGGSLYHNLYIKTLALTSATFASAMTNLVPAITFILAVSFGLERLGLGTIAGKAKVLGTVMEIGGALLLTFYRGAEINIWSTNINLLHHGQNQSGHSENLLLGAALALGSCFSFATWLIIQAKMSERYPCHYSSAAVTCMMGAIQSAVFALCMDHGDWSQWKLGWNVRLLTVSYSGIVGSGVGITLIAWCVRMRGPSYVTIFNPLTLVSVAIMGSLVLDEKLHLGSILGAVLIVCGLCAVLWGKGKEMKENNITRVAASNCSPDSELTEIVVMDNNTENNTGIKTESSQLPIISSKASPIDDHGVVP